MSRFVLVALVLVLFAPGSDAQYFGRNKVQWEHFDFKVLKTDHFDIYYYDQEEAVINDIGRMAERWYSRLSRVFDHEFTRKPIVLYANSADFQQTTTTSGLIGEGTGGFTDAFINRVVLPLTGNYAENDHVLGHEMVHVFQFELAQRASRTRRGFTLDNLPLWIIEGMAEYFSKGRVDPLTAMWMRDATLYNRLPDLNKLNRDPRYFPYRYGEALMAYIGGRFGDDEVVKFFLVAGTAGIEQAFSRLLGTPHKQFFKEWHDASRALYDPILQQRPDYLGEPIIGAGSDDDLNIGPSVSPDGQYVAFLSARELFSIDLFLADARTGKVIKKLVSSAANPHFDALRFIDSAGGWSPDSKKLAFVVFERGDNRLGIVDVESGKIERIGIESIDAMSNPSWSPDGVTVAFSGMTTGTSDLFTYNIQTRQLRQWTKDKYADLQPVFSPDGKSIAFVSDRGAGTNLELLRYNDLKIAVLDTTTSQIRELPLFENAKHINPQYGPDGSIYFIANPIGIADVYRYTPSTNIITRMTRVPTGVAGITDLAPALGVASRTGDVLFTVYRNDDYDIYRLPPNAQVENVAPSTGADAPRAALLPPETTTASTSYIGYLDQPEEGLPPETTRYRTADYNPSLRVTYVGPPSIGIGADRFGYGASGSVHVRWGDILGRHTVGMTLQGGGSSTTSFENTFGGEVFYLNQEHRVNYGGILSHIPYISSFATVSREPVQDENGQVFEADVVRIVRDIVTVDEVTGVAHYPFSRTRRFEINTGYQHLGFDTEQETLIYIGGSLVDADVEDLPGSENIGLFRGSGAFVGDSSIFGFISPVRGTRYRFEVEALTGDLNFQTGLADWRRYFFARPFTFAIRGLHYGRYGSDAESDRLRPLYLGQPTLVRGYEIDDISASECVAPAGNPDACPVFDRLIGSKLAFFSTELRVPLFGPEGFGLIDAGVLPTELVGFFEGGGAWTEDEDLELEFDRDSIERVPVFSYGIAVRILLAYIPIQFYYAKPIQRPEEDGVTGFLIAPGW